MGFQAAVWTRPGTPLQLQELEPLPLRDKDVRIRVGASNVTTSDAIALSPRNAGFPQLLPQVMGAAAAGTVVETGPRVRQVTTGDRVVVTGTPQCSRCRYCLHGRADQCAELQLVGPEFARNKDGEKVHANGYVGGFAELCVSPEEQVTPVETSLTDEQLALLAKGGGTGVGAALRTAPVSVGSVVAAVGCGSVGLSYIQGARIAGASQIIAIDPIASRRALATELGATTTIDPNAVDPVQAVWDIAGDSGGAMQGRGADYVFESAAEPRAIEQAWAMTRTTGHLVLSSVPRDMASTVSFPAMAFALTGKTIHSCQFGSLHVRRDLQWLVNLVESDMLDVERLIDHRYALQQVNEAIDDAMELRAIAPTLISR